ncbi:MAG: DUF255 domain-containing protein [Planctomycetota bacterium]
MSIAWQTWSDELLRGARAERRLVLLSLVASWCRFCRHMEASTYADPAVAAAIAEHAVPVRVDKDLRPDLYQRYGQGGWPSTVLLAGDGSVLAGGTFFDAPSLVTLLVETARRLRTEGPIFQPQRSTSRRPSGRLDGTVLPALEDALLQQFDELHGGFGVGQKFPHPEALDFAILRQSEQGSPRLREVIEKTLTHMADGALHDAVEGGFFRYCGSRDWRAPHTEKLLDLNAGLARNYLEAGQLMQRADFLRLGERTAEALLALFRDRQTGLFHASLDADEAYYALDLAGRRTHRPPRRDGRFRADGIARAVSALLKAGAVLRRPDLTEAGVAAALTLVEHMWRPQHGVSHSVDEAGRRLPGTLRDQAETARALLHLLQYTADRRVLPALTELLERLATRHVAADGELVDQEEAQRGAPPRRGEAAILDSAVAAEALLRGGLYFGREDYLHIARRALELHGGDFRRYGYAMSAYGRSVDLLLYPPLHILVVGRAADPRGEALFQAASRSFLPSRVVQRLDPQLDAEALRRLELPVRDEPVVYICLERDCAAEHRDPATLWSALAAANARRRL